MAALKENFDTDVASKVHDRVVAGIQANNIWLLPCNTATNIAAAKQLYKLVYDILEVCRLYGTSIAVFPSIGFNYVAYVRHPWIDTGNYIDALMDVDIAIIEGAYPDPAMHSKDWTMLQSALAQRVTKKNKPTLLLDSRFKDLPVVASMKQAQSATGVSDA